MKAVRIHEYGGPEVLVYEDVPEPEPKADQVLVRVAAATVNPIDVAVRENRFPTPKQPPKTIGSDGAGVVEKVGAGVTTVKPGDHVFFSGLGVGSEGSYAEYAVIHETQAVPAPEGLTLAEAAALGMVFPTAYYALVRRGAVQAGESVLVQGAAGGVGLGRGADRRRPRRPCRRDGGGRRSRRSWSAASAPPTSSTTRPRTSSPAAWSSPRARASTSSTSS